MWTWVESHPGVLGVVAILVTVGGIPIAVWATWRWSSGRRTKVIASWTSVQIVTGANLEGLEVRLKGALLRNPHVVTVSLRNFGPNDVSSENFHDGAPLKIELRGARAVDLVGGTRAGLPCTIAPDGSSVLVSPVHIPAKNERTVVLLTEAEPHLISFGDLVNVDLKCASGTSIGQEALHLAVRSAVWRTAILSVATGVLVSILANLAAAR